MDDKHVENKVFVSAEKLKRIKVTCRCGETIVEEIPGEVLDSEMVPVIGCRKCKTEYAVQKDRLIRLDRYGRPEKVLTKEKPNITSASDTFKKFSEEQSVAEVEKLLEELRRKGMVVKPEDFRTIN